MKRAGAGALLVWIATAAATARAADEPRFVVDTYDIIGGCPDEAAFRAEVERRVHARTKAPLHVAIHVNQQPRNIDGTVEVVDPSGARSVRKVNATQCSEIVSAAALVVALAIDDAAENAPAPRPAPPPAGEVTPNVAPLTIDTSSRDAAKSDDLVLRAGAQAAVQTGVVPKPVLSVPLFVELGSEARFPGLHFEPRARLSWTFAASAHGSVAAGAADFAWMAGAVDVCPVRLALATRGTLPFADLRACGRIEIGKLDATGEGTVSTPLSDSRLWLGAGIPFNARIAPRGLGGVFFEVEAGPRFALVRDEFQVGPSRSLVFQPPPLAFSGGIGAGIGFR